MNRFNEINISTLCKDVAHYKYEKATKYRILWNPSLCHYRDLIFTLWLRLTNRNTMIDNEILSNLEIPSNKYTILIRFELAGFVVINSESPDGIVNINKIKSYPFTVKFTYEIPKSYLIKGKFNNQLFKKFIITGEKKFNRQYPHIDLDKTTVMNFQSILTDISIKDTK